MESQSKSGFDGTQRSTTATTGGYVGRTGPPSSSNQARLPGYILRVIAILLTFIAAIVMGVAKQTKTFTQTDPSTGDVVILSATAKSTYSSAFVYFIVANVLAFLYTAVSLAISLVNRAGSSTVELPFAVADLVMVALLFSSNAAATAVSVIAEKGNSHLGWDKICNEAGKFCGQVAAAIVLSMLASVAYVLLVALAVIGLHKRS